MAEPTKPDYRRKASNEGLGGKSTEAVIGGPVDNEPKTGDGANFGVNGKKGVKTQKEGWPD